MRPSDLTMRDEFQVLYCSGDVHAGNVTRKYMDSRGENVVQSGAENSLSVMKWLAAQHTELDELVVTGCSAGSIGAQVRLFNFKFNNGASYHRKRLPRFGQTGFWRERTPGCLQSSRIRLLVYFHRVLR